MCGILITTRPGLEKKLSHRGLCCNRLSYCDYAGHITAIHHWLPIQTEIGVDEPQPFVLRDGSILLYNGEIFNYPKAYPSDSAYLKALFEYKDMHNIIEEANKWDGFWSIVYITDGGWTYCLTDPLGKKQLYYNTQGEICSEIRPLLTPESKMDLLFRSSVMKWGYNRDDRTPWQDIKRILPNRVYIFNSGVPYSVRPADYYDWSRKPETTDLYEALFTSVERRLVTRKEKIASLISGGLDSSIIACLLEEIGQSVSYYTTDNLDDQFYVKELSEALGISPQLIHYDMDLSLEDSLEWNETPIDLGSLVPQHKLMSSVKERIVLTGDGADELFGGYSRINQYDSQQSDIFEELTYYHLPRLDRASMRYTIEMRNPFLSHDVVKIALATPFFERKHKKILKDLFKGKIPSSIINRPKIPLKNDEIRKDPMSYRNKIMHVFYNLFKNYQI